MIENRFILGYKILEQICLNLIATISAVCECLSLQNIRAGKKIDLDSFIGVCSSELN